MEPRLKMSQDGLELLKSFEGLRLTAARLPDGRWTVSAWAPLDGRVFNGGVRLAF